MTQAAPFEPIYVRCANVQKIFGVSRATVYRWAKEGRLTIHRPQHAPNSAFVRTAEMKNLIEGVGD